MKNILITLSIFILSSNVLASGLNPFCKFTDTSLSALSPDSKYKLSEAYAASDIVLIGQYRKNQNLLIEQIIKGKAIEVSLVPHECNGTACTGLSLPETMSFLFLLRRENSGFYNKVDGNGNDICPNVFEIKEGKAVIGRDLVPVKNLDKFLKSKKKIPFF